MRFRALIYLLLGAALLFRSCGAIGDAVFLGWRTVAPMSTGQGARSRHPTDTEAKAFNLRANHEFERAALLLVVAGGALWAFRAEWRRRRIRQATGERGAARLRCQSFDGDPTREGRNRRRIERK
jgi:hypothetical protein